MPRIAVLLLIALAACASSSASTPGAPAAPQSIRVSGGGGAATGTRIDPSNSAYTTALNLPIEDVWHFLPMVWDSLGIPKATIDPKQHLLSTGGMKIRQRLGKVPLSRYFDCGQTQIGPNADTYEVYLAVTTQVTSPGAGQSTLVTTVDAAARPLAFNQEYSRCSTRGTLEGRILDGVKAHLKP